MRGHAELMFVDMILMGIGILMYLQGNSDAIWIFGVGAVLHFASGGFSTGF
ncbi:MAG: hypothetical protein AABY04_01630 [Candidatus Micrarchaeota archaeon]